MQVPFSLISPLKKSARRAARRAYGQPPALAGRKGSARLSTEAVGTWRPALRTCFSFMAASLVVSVGTVGCGAGDLDDPSGEITAEKDAGSVGVASSTGEAMKGGQAGSVADAPDPRADDGRAMEGAENQSGDLADDSMGTEPTGAAEAEDATEASDAELDDQDGGYALPAAICEAPLLPYDTSAGLSVGDGSPDSCTEEALHQALEQGGVIRFDCGAMPHTIALTASLAPRMDTDTVLDGRGLITLDAQSLSRHIYMRGPSWQSHDNKLTLQGLTFINGKAESGEFFPPLDNPDCAYGYKEGSGGVVFMHDGNLEVIDCVFAENEAALLGPDVGGGAIYAVGSRKVVIVGSLFTGNRAANGGAVGTLHTTLDIYNSEFLHNRAEGRGLNFRVPESGGCPSFNHDSQGGAGGLAGGVYADGLDASGHRFTICGSRFIDNRANEMGGALFRTPNRERREMRIDRSTFGENTARLGGVSFIKDNHVVVRDSLFYGNRGGVDVEGEPSDSELGGLWINRGTIDLVNSTFHDNLPSGLVVDNRTTPGDDRPPSAGPEDAGEVTNVTFSQSAVIGSLYVRNSMFVETECREALAGDDNLQWPRADAECVVGPVFMDAGLSALGDHGGPTLTRSPMATGLDFGDDCPATDQRGEPRAQCVVGAVEP